MDGAIRDLEHWNEAAEGARRPVDRMGGVGEGKGDGQATERAKPVPGKEVFLYFSSNAWLSLASR